MASTTDARGAGALQFIFSLFLGILLVVLVGVGVWTFYPQPYGQGTPEQEQLDKLYRDQERIHNAAGGKSLDTTQTAELDRIQKKIDGINKRSQDQRDAWAVTTSIILLTFATVLMAVSLLLPEHMRVFSNGVLLGGVFTVIYGTGWSFAGGDSRARFFVVLAALALSVFFGYLRFVRGRKEAPAASLSAATPATTPDSLEAGIAASLDRRISALEARAAAAASALRGDDSEA